MAISVSIDKQAILKLKDRLQTQISSLKNKKPYLGRVAVEMHKSVMQNFKEEGTDKGRWVPLAPLTMFIKSNRKTRKETHPRILQDSGNLRQSIYPEVGEDYAIVGTNVPYATKMHKGGKSDSNITPMIRSAFPVQFRKYIERPLKKTRSHDEKGNKIYEYQMKLEGFNIPARPFMRLRESAMMVIKYLARKYFFQGKIQ